MNKLTAADIFYDSLCIFVDASITKSGPSYIGCPGCLLVYGDDKSYTDYIKLDSTNNRSELSAIQLGITQAIRYKHLGNRINLFSDSKLCIYSIKEWIFKWVNNINNGVIYGSSYTPIENQDIIINIVNTILYNNLSINLYHQKGHVNIDSEKSIHHAREVFIESNKIDIDIDALKIISNFNNVVDVYTKRTLQQNDIQNKKLSNPISFCLDGFDKDKYNELLRRNQNGKF